MVERDEINITWIENEKRRSDTLTKYGASSKILWDGLSSSKIIVN